MVELAYAHHPAEYGDPQALTKLRADAVLAAADVTARPYLANVTVVTELPQEAPVGRLLTVRSGPWVDVTAASATNIVRLVAWARNEDDAWDLASYFHAHLTALRGDDEFRGFGREEQPNKGLDPTYDRPIVAFALRARMKPRLLPI